MPQNTASANISQNEVFSRVPKSNAVVYSTFDRSHRHLTAIDASYVYPIYIDEVYPGDIFRLEGQHLNRLLTPVKPFMDNVRARYIFFYSPNRLVWRNWKKLMGERRRPTSNDQYNINQYQVPMLDTGSTGVEVGSIFDIAGIRPGVPNVKFSCLPFRHMNLCYNEWMRDENLCPWLQVGGTGSTPEELEENEFGDTDQLSNYSLFRIAKPHDFATSCLPFQQLGAPMSINIGSSAPVVGNGSSILFQQNVDGQFLRLASQGNGYATFAPPGSPNPVANIASVGLSKDPTNSGVIADLTSVTGFTISDLRTAIQLQALKELNARMGHRYKEIIYGEFDVLVSDATLDRPEFLGSYTITFNTIPVVSTAETADNPQGNLSAFSFTDNSPRHGFTKAFEEHGFVIGFLVVQGDQTYQQGLDKFWTRKNKYDFYTPLLSDISEQEVKMQEILLQDGSIMSADGVTPVNETTFGFQEAWYDLRYKRNMVTGKMRSGVEGSLDVWHLATNFSPTMDDTQNLGVPLNEDFINDNTRENLQRVLAVKDEPQIESDNYFNLYCTRELPIYSVPAYLTGRL